MKFKEGQQIYIKFLDHVQDGDEPMVCELWGYVEKDAPNSVTIVCWRLPSADQGTKEDNELKFCVLKSTIIKRKTLG